MSFGLGKAALLMHVSYLYSAKNQLHKQCSNIFI